jgi:hypothetical protein
MESDSVRTSGDTTVVDLWIDGKIRCISVSREAIEAFLQLAPDRAMAMTDEDRREFVRTHLGLVMTAAANKLRGTDPTADAVQIGAGQLRTQEGGRTGERRQGDRRKGDRRAGPEGRREN